MKSIQQADKIIAETDAYFKLLMQYLRDRSEDTLDKLRAQQKKTQKLIDRYYGRSEFGRL